jgi:hypothetical protein
MTITTEEAELLAQTHDLARSTLGMKAPEHDLTSAALRDLAAERDALKAKNALLREALRLAIDAVEFWAAYATPYFQDKHDLAEDLQKLRAALGETP